MIYIEIPGEPIGQGRPRATVGKDGKPRVYSPKTSSEWRARAAFFMKQGIKEPFLGPVRLEIVAHFTLPKSRHRKRFPLVAPTPCTKKPDFDNIAKAVCDAGNGILFGDDAQVCDCRILKYYVAQGAPAKVVVAVEELP